mmetsp:Transcript_4127/g.9687  ORF Transcript_4127/g.9687 Transcript_4127/m.9687 type:complete len:688 (-) Transcript_4127:244-2307(-)
MSRSRVGRYTVRIYDVSCEDLVGKDRGGKSDPYCKFDFDKYRKFNTEVVRKSLNPRFKTDESFNYATQYADRLYRKNLVVTVQDKDFWGKDYLGTAKVDLHTILTGPVDHNLAILDKGEPAGRIKFKVEMTEMVHFKIFFKSACINNLPRINGREPSVKLTFTTNKPEHKLNVESQQVRGCDPEFHRTEQLRFTTNLRDLMYTNLHIGVVDSELGEIGSAKLEFQSHINTSGDNVTWSLPIRFTHPACTTNTSAKLEATVYYKDFPTMAHMIGGEHNDNGIVDSQFFHPIAEKPKVKIYGASSGRREQKRQAPPPAPRPPIPASRPPIPSSRPPIPIPSSSPPIPIASSRPPIPIPASRPPIPVSVQPTRPSFPSSQPQVIHGTVQGAIVQPRSIIPINRTTLLRHSNLQNGPYSPTAFQTVVTPSVVPAAQPVTVTPVVVSPSIPQQSYLDKLHPSDKARTLRMGLPAPWSCHVAPDGRPYYVNHDTKKTQWVPPNQSSATVRPYGETAQMTRPSVLAPISRPSRSRFPPVDGNQLASLTNMGFNKDLSQEALIRNANDIQRSVQWLSTSPVPLSTAWDLRVDNKTRRLYYANREGKFTQWDRPIISEKHEPMLRQLLQMGFQRRVAVEALAHYKGDAQAATNWILYNSPQPLPSKFALIVENNIMLYLDKGSGQRYSNRPVKPTF